MDSGRETKGTSKTECVRAANDPVVYHIARLVVEMNPEAEGEFTSF